MPGKPIPRRKAHIYLEEWLADRKMSQTDLAAKLRVTKGQISKLINGKQPYSAAWLNRIAAALDCEVYELYHPPLDKTIHELYFALSERRRKMAIRLLADLNDEQKQD